MKCDKCGKVKKDFTGDGVVDPCMCINENLPEDRKEEARRIEEAIQVLRDYKPEKGRSITWAVADVINFLEGKSNMVQSCPHINWRLHARKLYSCT